MSNASESSPGPEVPCCFRLYTPEYFTLHKQVKRTRGSASEHQCIDCGGPARDWARLHDKDGSDIWDYVPMCHKCHSVYDLAGRPKSAEHREKLSQYQQNRTPEHQKNLSASLMGRVSGMAGKTQSAETRQRMSEAHRGKKTGPMPLEARQKIGNALRGKRRSPEAIAKGLETKARQRAAKQQGDTLF